MDLTSISIPKKTRILALNAAFSSDDIANGLGQDGAARKRPGKEYSEKGIMDQAGDLVEV